jgi:hypothetical protein
VADPAVGLGSDVSPEPAQAVVQNAPTISAARVRTVREA